MLKQHPDFDGLQQRVFSRLRSPERKHKYAYATIGHIPHGLLPQRLQFLCEYYVLMREVDDIIDDDAPLPHEWQNRKEYIHRKIAFANEAGNPEDDVERVMQRCAERVSSAFGDDAGESLWQASANVLEGLRFDRERREQFAETKTPHIFSENRLGKYVTDMELHGVMRGFLTALGDDHGAVETLAPLVCATRRHFFFLRDLPQDVNEGCINLTEEECPHECSGLEVDSLVQESAVVANGEYSNLKPWQRSHLLHGRVPQFASEWMEKQLYSGEQELQVHESERRSSHFRPFTRLLLHLLYKKPANTYFGRFRNILGNQHT